MNVLRGIISFGITISCFLNWIDLELIRLSGMNWGPTILLFFASLLTSGYAFYNSYNKSNHNSWLYLITGLLGIGICVFTYVFVIEKMQYIDMVFETLLAESIFQSIGIGFYLTGFCSTLLFFTGFDKSNNTQPVKDNLNPQITFVTRASRNEVQQTNQPDLKDWLKDNPGKSINDYFSKFK